MAKIFYTDGVGAQQTLNESDSNKIKVYDDYNSIDTSELVDGEIVSTKETSVGRSNVYDYIDSLMPKSWDFDFVNQQKVAYRTTTATNGFHICNFVDRDYVISFTLYCEMSSTRTRQAWFRFFKYLEDTYNIDKTRIQFIHMEQQTTAAANNYHLIGGYYSTTGNIGWRVGKFRNGEPEWAAVGSLDDVASANEFSIGSIIGTFIFTKVYNW